MTAILAFFGSRLGQYLIVGLLIVASYGAAYVKGRMDNDDKRDEMAKAELKEQVKQSAVLAQKRVVVTTQVVTKYVDRIKLVEREGAEVIRYVEKLIPANTPDLPSGFRVLHDAAALGQLPLSPTATDGPPEVPVTVAAETIATNYQTCRLNIEQLKSLQDWVTEQKSLK